MASGGSAKTTAKCVTPPLRLANVLPSADSSQLYIYVRNDGGEGIQLSQLLVNEKAYAIGQDPNVTLVGAQEVGARRLTGGGHAKRMPGSFRWGSRAVKGIRL